MIRKAIIVVLALAAVAPGTIGVLCGSRRTTWRQTLWSSGEVATTGHRETSIFWANSGDVLVIHRETLGELVLPIPKHYHGPGWDYYRDLATILPSRLTIQSTTVIVSFFILILFALLFASYPAVVFIRGPLRRYRRRMRGECLACGYNLTGLPEPRCPECGTEIRPS